MNEFDLDTPPEQITSARQRKPVSLLTAILGISLMFLILALIIAIFFPQAYGIHHHYVVGMSDGLQGNDSA